MNVVSLTTSLIVVEYDVGNVYRVVGNLSVSTNWCGFDIVIVAPTKSLVILFEELLVPAPIATTLPVIEYVVLNFFCFFFFLPFFPILLLKVAVLFDFGDSLDINSSSPRSSTLFVGNSGLTSESNTSFVVTFKPMVPVMVDV